MNYGLLNTLMEISEWYAPECRSLFLPDAFMKPGMWSALAAFMDKNKVPPQQIEWGNKNLRSYAQTLKLEEVLGYNPSQDLNRPNEDNTYTPLVRLNQRGDGRATANLIGNFLLERVNKQEHPGILELVKVIGELFDNVEAHGCSPAFGCAQIYQGQEIEFALVDYGIGFLEEIKSSRQSGVASSHREAIDWCLQEGTSTKEVEDEWAQQIPHSSSVEQQTQTGNHHQGLGLYEFQQLAASYNASLYIASGDCVLGMSQGGQREYNEIPEWRGVALSCSFHVQDLTKAQAGQMTSEETQRIMDRIRL